MPMKIISIFTYNFKKSQFKLMDTCLFTVLLGTAKKLKVGMGVGVIKE